MYWDAFDVLLKRRFMRVYMALQIFLSRSACVDSRSTSLDTLQSFWDFFAGVFGLTPRSGGVMLGFDVSLLRYFLGSIGVE